MNGHVPAMEPCETIKIGKISIDLAGSKEKNRKKKCDHFTIRGFVSEARKKDLMMCWPFSSEADGFHLPPLHVPRYKFWGCENCLLELDFSSCTNDAVKISSKGKNDDARVVSEKKRDETATAAPEKEKEVREEDGDPRCDTVLDVPQPKCGDTSNDNGGLSHRKRARKVRLLTDLLCANAMKENKKVASMKRGLNHCKKRKSSHDEEWKPTCANRVKKKTKATKKEEILPIEAAPTEDLETAFAKMCIEICTNESPNKKKKQKSWILGGELPTLESINKRINQTNQLEVIESVDTVSKTREMDLFPLSASTLDLEKTAEVEDRPYSFFNESAASSFHEHADSSRDASLDKALNLSLNSYISPQAFDFGNQQPAVTCNSANPVLHNVGSGCRASTCSYNIPFLDEKENKGLYGKRSEQGEFPIEIVELMAQNQYERRRLEFPPMIDFSNVNPRKEISFFQPETRTLGRDFAEPKIPNSFDFFSQNAVKIGQPQAPVGFRPFLEHSDISSSEFQRCFPCVSCQQQKKDTWPPFAYPLAGPSSSYLSRFPDFPRKEKRANVPKKKQSVSLDLYSNEAIPAMHLLSLMDAGVGSSTKTADVQRGLAVSSSNRVSDFSQKLEENKYPYLYASNDSDKAKNKRAVPVCTVNRNPADFSFPDELNVYMIRGEMLKFDDAVDDESVPILKPKRRRSKIAAARAQRPLVLNNVMLN